MEKISLIFITRKLDFRIRFLRDLKTEGLNSMLKFFAVVVVAFI